MKIFIIAYACEPGKGSEPGLGWNIAGEIARRHDVTVLTRANNRSVIQDYIARNNDCPQAKILFLYYDKGGLFQRIKKLLPFGNQIYFSAWLKAASMKFGDMWREYDIVHQLTFSPFFVRPWGALFTQKYVWGPIGGGGGPDARMGRAFLAHEPIAAATVEYFYRFMNWYVNKSWLGYGFRKCRERSKVVVFKARAFAEGFVPVAGQRVYITKETGYSGDFKEREYDCESHPLRILSVGRMIPFKAFGYGIKAFAEFLNRGGRGELALLGNGPQRKRLEKLVKHLGVEDKVRFLGNVPNSQVHNLLDEADLFLHPSFIEAGAWSILEAMIHGVPILCQDRSGMADMVTVECGTLVKAATPVELISRLADGMETYFLKPSIIQIHGRAAQKRVKEEYSWNAIGEQVKEVYNV